mgnify:CR=1 FL=1
MAKVEQLSGSQMTQHRVRNISAGGVLIDNANKLRPDQPVTISFGTIKTAAATVRWVHQGFAGLCFSAPGSQVALRDKISSSSKIPAATAEPKAGWYNGLRDHIVNYEMAYHGCHKKNDRPPPQNIAVVRRWHHSFAKWSFDMALFSKYNDWHAPIADCLVLGGLFRKTDVHWSLRYGANR